MQKSRQLTGGKFRIITRGNIVRCLAALLVAVAASPAEANSDVCYKGGALLPNFNLVGNAYLTAQNLVITDDAPGKVSAIWYQPKFFASSKIHIELVVYMKYSFAPADGIAFVMQPSGTSALGGAGGGIGYYGLSPSIEVEFDTWMNNISNGGVDYSDPNYPHVALMKNGDPNHGSTDNLAGPTNIGTTIVSPSGTTTYIWIDWEGSPWADRGVQIAANQINVFISSTETKPAASSPTLSANLDLASYFAASSGGFYIGFVGSTGGSYELAEALNIYASDHNTDPKTACCDSNSDCSVLPSGPICDTVKHLCGPCTGANTTYCKSPKPVCDLSGAINKCTEICTDNYGSVGGDAPCLSAAFPVCNNGQCTSCSRDYSIAGSNACGSGAPYCGPDGYCGRCTQDTDCTTSGVAHAGQYCDRRTGQITLGQCVTSCPSGQICGNPNGHWCNASGQCSSNICDTDNYCGYANGRGTCTASTASQVCRSGFCSASTHKCVALNGGCTDATDCASGYYCDLPNFLCKLQLENGATCASSDQCTSEACDTVANGGDNKCGYANGRGSCEANTSDAVCRSGVCGSDGVCGWENGDPNGTCTVNSVDDRCRSGMCSQATAICVPATNGCTNVTDCAGGYYCDLPNFLCQSQLANGANCASSDQCTSGVCANDFKCGEPNGELCASAAVCRSGVCEALDNRCGYLDGGDSSCTQATAATVCRSGACSSISEQCIPAVGNGCITDADCDTNDYFCDTTTLSCQVKLSNGTQLPLDHNNGKCTTGVALAVCVSGVCDTADDRCGYMNGDGPCTQVSATVVCRSSSCGSSSGVCITAGGDGCSIDADCDTSTSYCNTTTTTCQPKSTTDPTIPAASSGCTVGAGRAAHGWAVVLIEFMLFGFGFVVRTGRRRRR